jgi:N-acetylglucosamine-6-phosphate deacetylase
MTTSRDRRVADFVLRRSGLSSQQVSTVDSRLTYGTQSTATDTDLGALGSSYFVEGLPVEIHCHSMGNVDFSDFRELDLRALDAIAAAEGVACVPTMYLAREKLDEFITFMRLFHQMRRAGLLPFVPAVALEGPLLASHGGTPAATVWPPTRAEWTRLAACGPLGLAYIVISPDGLTPESDLYSQLGLAHPDLEWIVRTLVESGVRPALGHYTKLKPERAAELTYELVDIAHRSESPIAGARVVTDHLFNDMPMTIKHAFRTRRALAERDALVESYDLPSWNLDDLPHQVGPVPAAIMRLCHEGKVASCINFDGEHVDLAIAARAVEVIGASNIMLMTDRCDAARLGGQDLYRGSENTLWYQDGGVVAAGSQPLDKQLFNARRAGVSESRLWDIVSFTAYSALGLDQDPWVNPANTGSFVWVEPEGQGSSAGFTREALVSASSQYLDDRRPTSGLRSGPITIDRRANS